MSIKKGWHNPLFKQQFDHKTTTAHDRYIIEYKLDLMDNLSRKSPLSKFRHSTK
jgi:hypothetical protein